MSENMKQHIPLWYKRTIIVPVQLILRKTEERTDCFAVYRLRDLREDSDLKQRDLAALLNCTQACYSRYEKGSRDLFCANWQNTIKQVLIIYWDVQMSQHYIQNQSAYNNCCRIIFGGSYFCESIFCKYKKLWVLVLKY